MQILFRLFEQIILDFIKHRPNPAYEFFPILTESITLALVPSTNKHIVFCDISRAHFNTKGDTFFNPLPHLIAPTNIAIIQFNL